jgi:aromatic ring hydroxylase
MSEPFYRMVEFRVWRGWCSAVRNRSSGCGNLLLIVVGSQNYQSQSMERRFEARMIKQIKQFESDGLYLFC